MSYFAETKYHFISDEAISILSLTSLPDQYNSVL